MSQADRHTAGKIFPNWHNWPLADKDEGWWSEVNLPFTFPFYGVDNTTVKSPQTDFCPSGQFRIELGKQGDSEMQQIPVTLLPHFGMIWISLQGGNSTQLSW